MKNKNYIGNFIYFILIAILLACGTSLLSNHYTEAQRTFEYSLFYITIIIVIFFGGIGVVLGLSNVNFSVKKIKELKLDRSRLLLLVLPSFIISMTHIWALLGLLDNLSTIYSYIIKNQYIIIISSIILGNSIVSSIYIEKNE